VLLPLLLVSILGPAATGAVLLARRLPLVAFLALWLTVVLVSYLTAYAQMPELPWWGIVPGTIVTLAFVAVLVRPISRWLPPERVPPGVERAGAVVGAGWWRHPVVPRVAVAAIAATVVYSASAAWGAHHYERGYVLAAPDGWQKVSEGGRFDYVYRRGDSTLYVERSGPYRDYHEAFTDAGFRIGQDGYMLTEEAAPTALAGEDRALVLPYGGPGLDGIEVHGIALVAVRNRYIFTLRLVSPQDSILDPLDLRDVATGWRWTPIQR
jgi:hypothetical protein